LVLYDIGENICKMHFSTVRFVLYDSPVAPKRVSSARGRACVRLPLYPSSPLHSSSLLYSRKEEASMAVHCFTCHFCSFCHLKFWQACRAQQDIFSEPRIYTSTTQHRNCPDTFSSPIFQGKDLSNKEIKTSGLHPSFKRRIYHPPKRRQASYMELELPMQQRRNEDVQ
jgi:hypothetical protein